MVPVDMIFSLSFMLMELPGVVSKCENLAVIPKKILATQNIIHMLENTSPVSQLK